MNEINIQTVVPVGIASRQPTPAATPAPPVSAQSSPQPLAVPADRAGNKQVEEREQKEPQGDSFAELDAALNEILGAPLGDLKLRIDLDKGAGRFVYQSVNRDTGEVIRQFPTDEVLRLLSSFREATGLTVDLDA